MIRKLINKLFKTMLMSDRRKNESGSQRRKQGSDTKVRQGKKVRTNTEREREATKKKNRRNSL